MEPAVLKRLGGRLGIVEILAKDRMRRVAADQQLADLTGRHIPSRLIDDPDMPGFAESPA